MPLIDAIITPTTRPHHIYPSHTSVNVAELFGASSLIIRNATIAAARNKGLTAARACGWKTVLLLDDDIRFCDLGKIRDAVRLLDDVTAVNLAVRDFPDNSVVRHAARLAGYQTPVWPGGSALLVNMAELPATRFFPDIYNEDWFFLHGLPVVMAEGIVSQDRYDPFIPGRAAREEFGDLIAEALSRDETGAAFDGDETFWAGAIRDRENLIAGIMGMTCQPAAMASLRESLKALNRITVREIRGFLASWKFHCL